jgi:hypothetical protein
MAGEGEIEQLRPLTVSRVPYLKVCRQSDEDVGERQ